MDLDKLKKEWNENIIPPLSQELIFNIIHKKGRSALGKLLLIEKIGLISLPVFAVLFYYLSNRFSLLISSLTLGIYDIGCVCAIVWQIYKILLLRKIDLSGLDMISCLKRISHYKICIVREFFIGFGFFFLFLASFGYTLWLNKKHNENGDNLFLDMFILVAITIVVTLLVYQFFYFRQIKKIQTILSEIEYWEVE